MKVRTIALAAAVALALAVSGGGVAATETVYSSLDEPAENDGDEPPEQDDADDETDEKSSSKTDVSTDDEESITVNDTIEIEQINVSELNYTVAEGDEVEFSVMTADVNLTELNIEFAYEDEFVGDEQAEPLESLVLDDSTVASEVDDLIDEAGDGDNWTAKVTDYEDGFWASDDGAVAEVELSHHDTDDAVAAYVDIDEQAVVEVIPVRSISADELETTNVSIDDTEGVDDDSFEFETK